MRAIEDQVRSFATYADELMVWVDAHELMAEPEVNVEGREVLLYDRPESLTLIDVSQPVEVAGALRSGRSLSVAGVVAAAALVVVAVFVVTDGEGSVVVSDLSPTGVDSLRYEWSLVQHDEAVLGGEDDLRINSVTVGGPGLVAVGSAGSGDDGDAAVWISVDGVTWSRVPHDELIFGGDGQQAMNSVTAGGPGLVAVGHNGVAAPRSGDSGDGVAVVWTSVDGFTWARVPDDPDVFGEESDIGMFGVTVGGPGVVAVGGAVHDWHNGDAAVWTSIDGVRWSRVSHDDAIFGGYGAQRMNSVTSGGPGLIAVGSNAAGFVSKKVVWTSTDGIVWSPVPHDVAVFVGERDLRINSVTVGGPGFVAVGSAGSGDEYSCSGVDLG